MLKRLIPDTLAGRTIVILLFGLGLFHLWSLWIYQLGIKDLLGTTREEQLAERLVAVKRVIAALPDNEREQMAHALSTATMEIHWSTSSLVNPGGGESRRIMLVRQRLRELIMGIEDNHVRLAFADEGAPREQADDDAYHHLLLASVQLPDGSWLNFSVSMLRLASAPDHSVLGSLTAMALGILLVSVFLMRSVTAPLRSLASAADRIGIGAASADVPQAGPREVRLAAAAFNRMQARIKRLVDDRTQTLAAVSHDLKTPITRLRLRAHFVRDDELRQTIEVDLDEMEAMIQSTLDFLRGDSIGEEIKTVDIGTIIETVCDHLVDCGHDVVLRADTHAPLSCRPLAIKRAFSNLVDNAVKYGKRARVTLTKQMDALTLTIDDDGPGIPAAELDRVFDPFYRLEASRSRETGGAGLGLTVARSTIRAHGGDVTLANRSGGGLSITVTLPWLPNFAGPPADPGRNGEQDFRGQKRSNETHASTTDADARLYRKGRGKEAKLCFMGHALMENRHGLIVGAVATRASGHAERLAALHLIEPHAGRAQRVTVGADKGFDARDFVDDLRESNVTPHVARNDTSRRSAIPGSKSPGIGRTTRHPGYAVSLRIRKRIEEAFGWAKTVAGLRKARHRGLPKIDWQFTLAMAAYNLVRLPKLLGAAA